MAKPPGQCIFCGRRPPLVKITKEHVFGDWLRSNFPRDAATTHTLGFIDWRRGLHQPTVTSKRGQGHSGSKKVRCVCGDCNNGWLSNSVEDVAKSILTELMTGQLTTINPTMQRILATWAAKTVMTSEQIDPKKAVVHQSERTWLKDNLEPPRGWHIWVGSYSGTRWRDLAIFQHQGRLTVPSVDNGAPTEHNLELTMIGVGRLLFLVINSTWPRIWDILDGLGTPGGIGLSRIWPVSASAISWPRPMVLTDAEAEYFTTYIARVLEQPAKP